MKYSIIIATYNAEKTVRQALESVLNQTYTNLELIVIDGASTDETMGVLAEYGDKITYWISEPDDGIYDALNKGVAMASGDYIYIMGADDCFFDKNILQVISAELEGDVYPDVISGRVWSVDTETKMQFLFDNNLKRTKKEDFNVRVISSPHQGMFVRTEVMKKFMFDESLKVGADYKLLLQLWSDPKIRVTKIPNIIAFYSVDGTSSRTYKLRWHEHIKALDDLNLSGKGFEKQYEYLVKKNYVLRNAVKKIMDLLRVRKCYLRHKGWVEHRCDWTFCRWCHRGI